MISLKGKTALVTGASSGIGKVIAQKLAAAGVHLVLVARSQDMLNQLAAELTQTCSVRCLVMAADLAQPHCGAGLLQKIRAEGMTIDILVNNAGFGTYGPFETLSPQAEQNEIAVNIAALVDLSHAVLPDMLGRGSGVILNIASVAAFQPVPYMAVYAASKAFVLSFSEALWAEYRPRGIHVAALCPGAVETAFISALGNESVRKTSAFASTLTPDYVAGQAMKAIQGTSSTYITGFKNWLTAQSLRFLPRSMVAAVGANMMRPPQ